MYNIQDLKEITSVANEEIQLLKSLIKDKKARYSANLFIAEGWNIIKDIDSNIIEKIYLTKNFYESNDSGLIEKNLNDIKTVILSEKVMQSVSDTVTPQGILAVVKMAKSVDDFDSNACVLDNISDPGNMGTILRTALACGVKNIYLLGGVDCYSPKVVRSSMSAVTKMNIHIIEDCDIPSQYEVLALDMNGENVYNFKKENKNIYAVLVGNETKGISSESKKRANKIISLPMNGNIESLNASVALSVALYQITFGS